MNRHAYETRKSRTEPMVSRVFVIIGVIWQTQRGVSPYSSSCYGRDFERMSDISVVGGLETRPTNKLVLDLFVIGLQVDRDVKGDRQENDKGREGVGSEPVSFGQPDEDKGTNWRQVLFSKNASGPSSSEDPIFFLEMVYFDDFAVEGV